MDQNSSVITFADIVSMFKGKGKAFLCCILIAAILCSAAGFVFSLLTAQYGGSVTLNVTVTDASRSLITLLSSDRFAERLLLDENGLPPKEYCNAEDYKAAVEAAEAYNKAREVNKELYREQQMFEYDFAIIEERYTTLTEEYDRLEKIIEVYKSVWSESVANDPGHAEATQRYQDLLDAISEERNRYRDEIRAPEVAKKLELNKKMAVARQTLKDAREAYDDASAKVISQWRQDPDVKKLVTSMSNAITCEYMQLFDDIEIPAGENIDPASLENTRFIVLNIKTSEGQELAEDILQRIFNVAPDYVEENLERLSGATEPQCSVISTLANATEQGESSAVKTTAIFALVGIVAAAAIFVIVIIIKSLLNANAEAEKKNKKAKGENSASTT